MEAPVDATRRRERRSLRRGFLRAREETLASAEETAAPEWRLVLRALAELSGFERGVLYDVPSGEAPRPLLGTRVFVRSSAAWQRYLAARATLDSVDLLNADTGDPGAGDILTPILALRPLDEREARLAIDWGCSYANAFLLVEPLDPSCDLTDAASPARRSLEAAARSLLRDRSPEDEPARPWTRETELGAAASILFGRWLCWPAPDPGAAPERVPLRLAHPSETLREALLARELPARYPQAAFDEALAQLYEHERELFGGTVARVRLPFLTRLGLPVLYEPRRVDYALRTLVNDGQAWVFEHGPDPAFYRGPQRRVPERMTDAEFEQLVVR